MHVTDMAPTHVDAVVALWEACGLTRPWNDPRDDIGRALAGPSSTVLVALDEGDLVGTAMVGHDGHRGWVYYVATQPGRRHEGLGRSLMDAAEAWLTARGIPKLQFMVRTSNEPVLAFYEHLGYAPQECVVLGRWIDGRPATGLAGAASGSSSDA